MKLTCMDQVFPCMGDDAEGHLKEIYEVIFALFKTGVDVTFSFAISNVRYSVKVFDFLGDFSDKEDFLEKAVAFHKNQDKPDLKEIFGKKK